jgi:hypothetical protein
VRFLSPPAGTEVAVGNQIFFQARAFARSGVARVEFAVNGSNIGSQSVSGEQRLYVATQAWTPSAAGSYTLATTAYDTSGQASSPSQVTITVRDSFVPSGGAPSDGQPAGGASGGESGEQPPGGESGEQPPEGEQEGEEPPGGEQEGEEPSAGPQPFVDFRADHTQLQAGESTILRWDVENVREVYLDGQPVTGHETREVWPFPPAQIYVLHVVFSSGEAQDYAVTIEVQGEFQPASGPDLAILAVEAPDRETDESVPFQAEVLNIGDEAARGAQWRWSINRSGDGPATWNMGGQFDLEVGQTTLLRSEAPPQPQGHWTIYVEVRLDGDDNQGNNRGSDDFDAVHPAGGDAPGCRVLTVTVDPHDDVTKMCPANLDFMVHIEVDGPCTVSWQWERSDGQSIPGHEEFSRAGRISMERTLHDFAQSGAYWVGVQVLEPNRMRSNRAEFRLTCE